MKTKKQKTENLPAVKTETFDLVSPVSESIELPPDDIMSSFDDEDFEGIKPETAALPIARIRQKDLKDSDGQVILPAGSFKLYDPVTDDSESVTIPDISGDMGLLVSFIRDGDSRVYFPTLGDPPTCRSNDGITGQGIQADELIKKHSVARCEDCPLSKMVGGEGSKCKAQKNILIREAKSGNFYVLNLNPSGLKPYKNFVAGLKRKVKGQLIPAIATFVRITTKFTTVKGEHYIPVFKVAGYVNDMPLLKDLRDFKRESGQRLESTIEVMPDDEEHADVPTGGMPGNGSEIPDGAIPVDHENKDGNGLPF